jgi:hypothetical protein
MRQHIRVQEQHFMHINLSTLSGRTVTLLLLFVPAILAAYFLHSMVWIIIVPVGIIAVGLFLAAFPIKRKVTLEQFADQLERHLLGTEGKWDWDDTTSIAITDERLERIRGELPKFDSLTQEKDKDELRALIAALRRGEVPELVPPTHLTYPNRRLR